MSVSGRSVFLDTALAIDDETADQFVRLPRNTLSAAPAHRASRGLQAILVSFDRKVQHAIRRLAFERMILDARLKAETERMRLTEQNLYREPDVVIKTRVALKDNDYNIRRLAGDATPQILAALDDPSIQEALQLAVPTENDTLTEEEARIWRRKLISLPIPVRVDAPYRYASHDSPTVRGNKDLHNVLSSRTGEENLSYYQRSQLRYGKGRRGSTSIAGAWEEVWNNPQPLSSNTTAINNNNTFNETQSSSSSSSPRINTSNFGNSGTTYTFNDSPNRWNNNNNNAVSSSSDRTGFNNNLSTTTNNVTSETDVNAINDIIAQLQARVSQLTTNSVPVESSTSRGMVVSTNNNTTILPPPSLSTVVTSPRNSSSTIYPLTTATPAPTPSGINNSTVTPSSSSLAGSSSAELVSRAKLLLAELSLA